VIIQFVRLESRLSEDEMLAIAHERSDEFRALPGLLQKYYVKLREPNHYGGIYVWDSVESLSAFRESELAASIPAAYDAVGAPAIELIDVLFQLRD
jgi:hypothetical protein